MNEALAKPSTSRLTGAVGALDRAFPLLWLGLYLLLPVSGWAVDMFDSWFDQRRDLAALQSLLADGRADAISENVIGPAYIAAAAAVHYVFGLEAEDALVALTRASYALSVAAGLVLVRVLVARSTGAPALVSLGAQLGLVGLVFAAGTWYWSDVPWSHFFAAFLAASLYAVRFGPSRQTVAWAAVGGALLALLAATRSFELLAVVLAWGIVAVGLRLLRLSDRAWSARRILAGAGAFLLATAVVYLATGKRELFFLYENHLDRQSGSLQAADVAETPTLSLGLVPVKLVQLFLDPCYLSLCSVSDYPTDGGGGQNVDLWSLPLAVQLPALLLLPPCLVGVAVLGFRAVRRRTDGDGARLRPLAEMTIAATGLVVGYAASTLSGPSHLRYGFGRDFILPALLTAIVAVVLGSRVLWWALSPPRRLGVSSEVAFVAVSFALAVVAVTATTVARTSGLPRIEGKHLASVVYSARCAEGTCAVKLVATTPAGDTIAIPEASTLTFGCGRGRERVTVYAADLDEVRLASTCENPRLRAAWPTVMGLPAGELELAAVGVRNA